ELGQAVAADTKLDDMESHMPAINRQWPKIQSRKAARPRKMQLIHRKPFLLFLTEFICQSRPDRPSISSSINPPPSCWPDAPAFVCQQYRTQYLPGRPGRYSDRV